jgi:hypothetical protein
MNLILIGTSYYSWDSRDEAFLAAVVICFILSFIWVAGVMLEYIVVTDTLIRMVITFTKGFLWYHLMKIDFMPAL